MFVQDMGLLPIMFHKTNEGLDLWSQGKQTSKWKAYLKDI